MPELPEVETVKRVLEPQISGLQIEGVMVKRSEVIAQPTSAQFRDELVGQRIHGMERRGKFLQILLQSGDRIVLHLRMTGSLLLTPPEEMIEKHTHVVFQLEGAKELRFIDTRRFGRFWLLPAGEADICTGMEKLGPEPFGESFSGEYLKACCASRKKTIKECLLDQQVVAGIGNIYADEILFAVNIRPNRPANTLADVDWERLAAAIPERLLYFIEKNEITPEEYLKTKGRKYRSAPYLQVYGHAGEPCAICGASLYKTVISGRSSVFCPACQRERD
ncbi:bifunctional DNA-formamidopyrimidine glycosylase/DNA-(apurinic or apyrimidinic site) lyase [Aminipila butyrica]|uniref:Formamidopyrimidine-DNA glycosylase n=1 Tax=Aminipila butyrica TaxID=433296 RepID=A0A858BY82_9FIRM|nr:bifunctional DNA-formamidopyrimidine glycosylase/DNA-(apurinic or apyrimidinic site) lyase [Aminipila butyrica]QIB70169.1 bifunctional DNA-formamidopyrimidine glycosylase/DNA-(apurinic or apyrimidinic site) lyase [Aminipila butyrica]